VAGGNFTDHVFAKMKERDILRLEGPLGSFFLREDSAKPIVFVASGTGFAPIKSIIESAFYKKIERPDGALLGRAPPEGPLPRRAAPNVGARARQFSATCRWFPRRGRRMAGAGAAASCTAR
jgi:hypothetical protein